MKELFHLAFPPYRKSLLGSSTRVNLGVTVGRAADLAALSRGHNKPAFTVTAFSSATFLPPSLPPASHLNPTKLWILLRCRSRQLLHPAIEEFMRLLLCCCCTGAHPPSTRAGWQTHTSFQVFPFAPSLAALFQTSLWCRNGRGARMFRSVPSFPRCSGLGPRTAVNYGGSEFEQERTTAARLPASQSVQRRSLFTQEPPLTLNAS